MKLNYKSIMKDSAKIIWDELKTGDFLFKPPYYSDADIGRYLVTEDCNSSLTIKAICFYPHKMLDVDIFRGSRVAEGIDYVKLSEKNKNKVLIEYYFNNFGTKEKIK